ncbi:alpha/beta-hydrolase family protein [Gordonia humi]|uniref:Alpha/beta-hydrolase catalytic domain-containing protein n=1 Tax=Gordonia humi TaxID=686429 RepID=A0A840FCD1_9ACTN|nr:alpha/beta-hydrolase family protein [Gordonia humi]MBB4137157.1 hypothetical protein [Gordonia humi]
MSARVSRAVIVGGLAGWATALAPGALPHPAPLVAAAGTLLMLAGMAVGRLVGRRARAATAEFAIGAGLVAGALLVAALWWQTQVAATVSAAAPGPGWVAVAGGVPLAVAAAVVVVPRRVWAAGALVVAAIVGPTAQANAAPDVPTSELLTYSRLDDRGFDARAEALVDAWAAAGGAGQDAVVVGVPTGSGWLDSAAVDGFDRRFRGSVRFVSMQYSQVPSWQAYVRSSDGATRSAIAVVRALDHRLHDGGRRPAVYLYGQSLGAIGADAARAWAQRNDVDIAGTVVSGAPAGTIEALPGCARRVSIANATDPVAEFSASLLWRPADDDGTRTVGVEPSIRVPWTPVVSLFGAALDLAVSLNGPVGTGHHYGVEQGLAVAQMPRGCQPTGPRAAS